MPGKVLFVVTNNCKAIGSEKKTKTGLYLPEAAHPYDVLIKAGYTVDFVSPKGGQAPIDESSLEAYKTDAICTNFLENEEVKSSLKKTLTPAEAKKNQYDALFYVGGHGPMFDLPECEEIAVIARDIYEDGGILGAVCHGTVGFVPIKLKNGENLVKGQKVTSFTNSEEKVMQLENEMPFALETKLVELGAKFVGAKDWENNVVQSGRLVTGQNPNSATACMEKMVELLKEKKK